VHAAALSPAASKFCCLRRLKWVSLASSLRALHPEICGAPFALLANCWLATCTVASAACEIIIRDTKLPKHGSKLCRDPSPVLARREYSVLRGKRHIMYSAAGDAEYSGRTKQLVKYLKWNTALGFCSTKSCSVPEDY